MSCCVIGDAERAAQICSVFEVDVNQTEVVSETTRTPLLAAIKAGQRHVVNVLLERRDIVVSA